MVARRTGLTPAALRAWEKRYRVVNPSRSEGGQRLYTDEDVLRLGLLQRVVEEGRNISQVADLTVEELQGLVREDRAKRRGPPAPQSLGEVSPETVLDEATQAVDGMEPETLERVLTRGALALPVPTLLDEVLVPLLARVGVFWAEGRLGPAHEHLSTVVIRRFLEWLLGTMTATVGAPVILTGTPAGERHELGALLAAVTAGAGGWRSLYLGPDLPAHEIVAAALKLEARVVALSVVEPGNAERVPDEVADLRARLPVGVHLVVGGQTAVVLRESLRQDGVQVLASLAELRGFLKERGEGFRA